MNTPPTFPSQRQALLQALDRRTLFTRLGLGAAAYSLCALDAKASPASLAPRPAQALPRARRVIYLFQNGGPSHVDLFDPKPALAREEGKKPGDGIINDVDVKKTGAWLPSPFKFRRYGRAGLEMSELLPRLGEHADRIALIRSMVSDHENHEQACGHMHTGSPVAGRPTFGSWICYGLGSENQNLPAYVAILNPAGMPVDGTRNWSSGWMPAVYQGMPVRASEQSPILHLQPHSPGETATARLEYLQRLNRRHLRTRGDVHGVGDELEARIAGFQLAARMQLAATDALNLGAEPERERRRYGLDRPETAVYGRELLMARRLAERGVRFIQVMMNGQPWDTHTNNNAQLRSLCAATDPPVGALLSDLHERGLLEDTLVIWTGEFGRTPFAEGKDGRDHHKRAFSMWMAGGGIQGGACLGATDEFGYESVEDIVTVADLHATVLHLLGLDCRRLTYPHGAREETLIDVQPARVIRPVLA